jgi:histidinol-phosphate aminotransferase
MRAFKAHLRGLSPYPYAKVEAPIKLDQNESPFDLPEALKEEALRRMARLPWNRYPEIHAEGLRRRLAALLDWEEEPKRRGPPTGRCPWGRASPWT